MLLQQWYDRSYEWIVNLPRESNYFGSSTHNHWSYVSNWIQNYINTTFSINFNHWNELAMEWHNCSYWKRRWSTMWIWEAKLLLIRFISHQTTRLRKASCINSHSTLLNFLDDKMIEGIRNNELKLSGEMKEWHINEHIFIHSIFNSHHTSSWQSTLYAFYYIQHQTF